ncbi:DUF805 domain-containing protein [Pseudomonadales bacterium]|nr:DUF805 domain-containing protein [Pseudomonadales bacterium]
MKDYFYQKNDEKVGPLSLDSILYGENSDQIKSDIQDDTLIWYEGLEDWIPAREDDDLQHLFIESPPPIPSNSLNQESHADQKSKVDVDSDADLNTLLKPRMFSNVFSFDGRIRRLEYGLSFLAYYFIQTFIQTLIAFGSEGFAILGLLIVPVWWALIMQGCKRSHDAGVSGWFQLIPFYILYLFFAKGDEGINKYGYPAKLRT